MASASEPINQPVSQSAKSDRPKPYKPRVAGIKPRRSPALPGDPPIEGGHVRGVVWKTHFSSDTFTAGIIKEDHGKSAEFISFSGKIFVKEGDRIILDGKYTTHPKYGRQFEVKSFTFDQELDAAGLASFLANHPALKGIGPARARMIAQWAGNRFEDYLQDPPAMSRAINLPITIVENLAATWQENKIANQTMAALSAWGLTYHQVSTLTKKYGASILNIIQSDPYVLVREVNGYGFKRVDKIALTAGTEKTAPSRIRAALRACLDEALDQGDTWCEWRDLVERANAVLIMDSLDSRDVIGNHLTDLVQDEELSAISTPDGRELVAVPAALAAERRVAKFLQAMKESTLGREDCRDPKFMAELVAKHAAERKIALNEDQSNAAITALSFPISLISGGAGSGKTTTVGIITAAAKDLDLTLALAAPTGKAARRMEEATGEQAQTIHRLLGCNGQDWAYDETNQLQIDLLVLDEVSMIDVFLADRMFRAINQNRTSVLLVGDHNQLPPVGPGNILRDIIENKPIPVTILNTIMRQAGALRANSMAILQGHVEESSGVREDGTREWYCVRNLADPSAVLQVVNHLYENVLTEKLQFNLMSDVQLLTPQHAGPLGTMALNIMLQRIIQRKIYGRDVEDVAAGKSAKILSGDKIICIRNNYKIGPDGVMNGTLGVVRDAAPDGSHVVQFDGIDELVEVEGQFKYDLALAYGLTCHKVQGSEFPCVIYICHKQHSFMHHRNLFYTAVTRAKKSAIILGDAWGVKNCAAVRQVSKRKTFLPMLFESN